MWYIWKSFASRRRVKHNKQSRPGPSRKVLRFEPLEDRKLLSGNTYTVDIVADENDGNFSVGDLSLREAIALADGNLGPDMVVFDPAVYGTPQTIALTLGEIEIVDDVSITGPGDDLLTIDAQQNSRIFNISTSSLSGDYHISGLTLTNGRTTGNDVLSTVYSGGAIRSATYGLLTLDNLTITGNSTAGVDADGGGVFAQGDVAITNSTISNNTAEGNESGGGGISSQGSVTLTDSVVSGNKLTGQYGYFYSGTPGEDNDYGGVSDGGGGIRAIRDVTLINTVVDGNETEGKRQDGGGIWTTGKLSLVTSFVSNNKTHGDGSDGGGIFAFDDDYGGGSDGGYDVLAQFSQITNNTTLGVGASGAGLFYVDNNDYGGATDSAESVFIDGCLISGNRTLGDYSYGAGAAVNGNLLLTNSTVSDNHTEGLFGGGAGIAVKFNFDPIQPFPRAAVTITNSTIAANEAIDGSGGGLRIENVRATITDSTISGNKATTDYGYGGGGGIFLSARSYLSLINATVSGNTANSSRGGGIYAGGGLNVKNSTVTDNHATNALMITGQGEGGGIAVRVPTIPSTSPPPLVTIENSIVAGNTSPLTPDISDPAGIILATHVQFSIIGDNTGTMLIEAPSPDINGNLIGSSTGSGVIVPLLGELADNGGPTKTHALPTGSLAINAGDPSFNPNDPDGDPMTDDALPFDQRGASRPRISMFRIDIGSYEVQTPSADFDGDGDIDGRDFLAWQRGYAKPGAAAADGDADHDEDVDGDDLDVWQTQYDTFIDDHGDSSSFSTLISIPSTTSGLIGSASDLDWFRFDLMAGTDVTFAANPTTLPGAIIRLLASDGSTVLASDADGGTGSVSFTIGSSGTYYAEVSGFAGATGSYTLEAVIPDDHGNDASTATVAAVPSTTSGVITIDDSDWFSFAAVGGSSYRLETLAGGTLSDTTLTLYDTDGTTQLRFDDDGGPDLLSLIEWPALASGTYYVAVRGFSANTGSYLVSVSDFEQEDDDHGNDASMATATVVPSTTDGVINAGDSDWFSFAAVGGSSYRLETLAGGTLSDTTLTLYGTDGTTELEFDDDDGPDNLSFIDWAATESGTYYFAVSGFSTNTGSYQVSITIPGGLSSLSFSSTNSESSRPLSGKEEISDLGFMILDLESIDSLSLAVSRRETVSLVESAYEDQYEEIVDRALEQFATVPSGVRSFGEMVARRKILRPTFAKLS